MGKGFGELAYLRGVITYTLSPYEQKLLPNLSKSFGNVFRRISENIPVMAPPFITAYIVYDQVEKYHDQLTRKNPADFENDV
ncbi:Cytochrome b-c1 complex subunit 8 [Armadillidium nasatum]|uniref:Cytochrome b-c1 complex subunit 8 n=1 Tax=Armadillidium nasatum TaxID=96803 RepID=A0A5N5TCQ0_9CRUS|nr:Cytochrome b-c1 complex subunit 8 [Armadillidium nasatum]